MPGEALKQSGYEVGTDAKATVPLLNRPWFQTSAVDLTVGSDNLLDKQVLWLLQQIGEIGGKL